MRSFISRSRRQCRISTSNGRPTTRSSNTPNCFQRQCPLELVITRCFRRYRRHRFFVGRLLVAAVVVALTLVQLTAVYHRPGDRVSRLTDAAAADNGIRNRMQPLAGERDQALGRRSDSIVNSSPTSDRRAPPRFVLADDSSTSSLSVFRWRDVDGRKVTCFRSGVEDGEQNEPNDHSQSLIPGHGRCRCRRGWHGRGCSIPDVVWHGRQQYPFAIKWLTLRRRPRRVIQAMPFNVEFDLLDVRLAEIGDVVDIFLVVESNYTSHGDRKPFSLRDRLRASGCDHPRRSVGLDNMFERSFSSDSHTTTNYGVSDEFEPGRNWISSSPHCGKIVVVELDFFPDQARRNGSFVERLLRDYLGTVGLSMVDGLRRSDLFILTDADELPTREVVDFLRWHDGYTQPVTFSYSLSLFNFGWGRSINGSHERSLVSSVTSIGFLIDVLGRQAFDIRNVHRGLASRTAQLLDYFGQRATPEFEPWILGSVGLATSTTDIPIDDDVQPKPSSPNPDDAAQSPSSSTSAGWHCSWCFPVDGIRNKMTSAQNGDFPRWGDFPEKLDPVYIGRLVECGLWFDGNSSLDIIEVPFVPRAVVENPERFGYLLPSSTHDGEPRNEKCPERKYEANPSKSADTLQK